MNLTRESIRAIDAIADPCGVLSLYGDGRGVSHQRRDIAERARAIRRRLGRVEAGLRDAGAAAVADQYRRWLPRIEIELNRLARATSPGAALFLPRFLSYDGREGVKQRELEEAARAELSRVSESEF